MAACNRHAGIADFDSLESDFNQLTVEIVKSASVIYEGKGEKLPRNILKTLITMQEAIDEVTNAEKKKMTKTKAASFTKLKSNFKKWLQSEDNSIDATFEKQMEEYKANPVESEEEKESDEEEESAEEEEEESEEEEDAEDKPKAEAKEGEEEYDDEYYDEEDEAAVASDDDIIADAKDVIDNKLKQKYIFLFKAREDMTPTERRWKWVRQDCLPEDMKEILQIGKKKKKEKEDKKKLSKKGDTDDEDDYITKVNVRNDLELDYTEYANVHDILKILKEERRKERFNFNYHAQVLSKMAD